MSLTQLLIQVAARGMALLLVTAVAGFLFRRASAATRHLIWTGGLAVSLIVPLISVPEPALPVLPSAPVATPSPVSPRAEVWSGTLADRAPRSEAPSADASSALTSSSVDAPRGLSAGQWAALGGLIWILGLILAALRLVAGWIAISRLARRAVPVTSPEWRATIRTIPTHRAIRFLESTEVATPCTWGTLAPTVLLPAIGAEWTAEERRQVVVHELAHVRRFDCATQVITTLAVALHWFNPLAWMAQRQCRVAREQACDDAVLAAGGVASAYAGLLLAAAAPEGGPWLPSEAQAMARRSQIGDRLLAVLDPARRRDPVDRRAIGWISTAAFAAAIPVVSLGFRPVATPDMSLRGSAATEAIPSPNTADSAVDTTSPRIMNLAAVESPAAFFAQPAPSAPTTELAQVPGVCDQSKQGNKTSSTSSSYTDDDGDVKRNWFSVNWNGRDCSVKIQGRGKITFTANEDDVASISDGGKFELESEEGSTTRSYRVISRGGTLERRYEVDDKSATLDADALQWRASLIVEFMRRTGYDAEARAGRILKRGGINALVTEIAAINSDGVRAAYLKVGLRAQGVSATDATGLLTLVQGIGSDGDRASVLKATPEALLSDEKVQRAYADAAKGIGSDGDKASVLTSAIRSGKLTAGSCEWVVGLASNIGSDGDRSAVLISATDALQWNSSCVRRSLEATREIGSDGDKAATLIRFLQKHGLPNDLVPVFFATTATIGSDGDHSSVLRRVIDLENASDVVVQGMLEDSRHIGSDGDHSAVLVAAARRGLVKSEKLRTLYRQSAEGIGSDGDREAAITALERS